MNVRLTDIIGLTSAILAFLTGLSIFVLSGTMFLVYYDMPNNSNIPRTCKIISCEFVTTQVCKRNKCNTITQAVGTECLNETIRNITTEYCGTFQSYSMSCNPEQTCYFSTVTKQVSDRKGIVIVGGWQIIIYIIFATMSILIGCLSSFPWAGCIYYYTMMITKMTQEISSDVPQEI